MHSLVPTIRETATSLLHVRKFLAEGSNDINHDASGFATEIKGEKKEESAW